MYFAQVLNYKLMYIQPHPHHVLETLCAQIYLRKL